MTPCREGITLEIGERSIRFVWGLMFFRDPVGALARLRNSLFPGGWLAVAIWGEPKLVAIISLPFSVFSRELGQPPLLPSGPNPFALSEPTRLEQVLREAGFAHMRCEPFTVTFSFASVDELLGHLGDVSAPIRMILATLSPLDQAEFWKKLADVAARFIDADGVLRLPNECLVAAGQRLLSSQAGSSAVASLLRNQAWRRLDTGQS